VRPVCGSLLIGIKCPSNAYEQVCKTLCQWVTTCLHGKPGNVREFDSCQGNVRDFAKSQGSVSEKNLAREKWHKTVYCLLHICVHCWLCWACAFRFDFESCSELSGNFTLFGEWSCSTPIYSFKCLKPSYHQTHTLMLTDKRWGYVLGGSVLGGFLLWGVLSYSHS